MSLTEIIVATALVLLLGGLMILAIVVTRRQSRDALTASFVRQAQAAAETFRARRGSYPGTASDLPAEDAALAEAFGYQATPDGCAPDQAELCRGYVMRFTLEGRLGGLTGGSCRADAEGLSCSK